jgi:ribosomal protein L27
MEMPDKTGGRRGGFGSAQPLEAFFEDAQSLSPEEFESRHGSGFLLLTATKSSSPKDTYSTDVQLLIDGEDDSGSAHTGSLSTLVLPVRSAVHIVTLGRASDNDVVVPDSSVSRMHAVMKRNDDGVFLILDAGSSNGTTVNGNSVLVRGHGPPTQVKPGDNVRLGRVECTFTNATALRDYVLQSC